MWILFLSMLGCASKGDLLDSVPKTGPGTGLSTTATGSPSATGTATATGTGTGTGTGAPGCAVQGGRITGAVTDGYGGVESDIEVVAEATGQATHETVTGADGTYILDLPLAMDWQLRTRPFVEAHTGCCGYRTCEESDPVLVCDSAVVDLAVECFQID